MRTINDFIHDEIYTRVNETMDYICKTHHQVERSQLDEEVIFSLWKAPLQAQYIDLPDGYTLEDGGGFTRVVIAEDKQTDNDIEHGAFIYDTPLEALEAIYKRTTWDWEEASVTDVFEHYAVSDWFARLLRKHGEQVLDILDFNVWCRTTTGQCVSMDGIIQDIYKSIMA